MKFIGAIAILASSALYSAPVPRETATIRDIDFPTEVGTTWVYVSSSSKSVRKYSIRSSVKSLTGDYDITIGASLDEKELSENYWRIRVNSEGLFEIWAEGGAVQNPPVCILELPISPGRKWTAKTRVLGGTCETEFIANRFSEVELDSGKLKCVEISSISQFGKSKHEAKFWYSHGIGKVKWTGGDNEWTLKEYIKPKKQ